MTAFEYKSEELKQILDIANGVIKQLEHFSKYFVIQRDELNKPIPPGMTDDETALFLEQRRIAEKIFYEMQKLAHEPLISWIKIEQEGNEKVILISRSYTPTDYLPLNFPNVIYANKFSSYSDLALGTSVDENFTYNGKRQKVLYRDRNFIPIKTPDLDGIENTIDLASGTFSIESLLKLSVIDVSEIPEKINEIIKKIFADADFRAGLRRRIIDNIQLRDQPVLDKYQISVYRTPLTVNLIITGSAGTGKTTVLINRISLATKPEYLTEDERGSLSTQGLNLLQSDQGNWVLYTPTELLKSYLQQAFNKEGVPAYDRTIKVWHDERMELGKNVFGFLKVVDNKGIFIRSTKTFFNFDSSSIVGNYSDVFHNSYLKEIEFRFYDAIKNLEEYKDKTNIPENMRNVKLYYENLKTQDLFDKVTMLIDRLYQIREEVLKVKNITDYKIDEIVRKMIRERKTILEEIVEKTKITQKDDIEEAELSEEELIESEELEAPDIIELTKDEMVQANQRLKNAITFFAERKVKEQSISSKGMNGVIIELIKEELSNLNKEMISVGQERIIYKIVNRLTSGYVINLVQLIPRYYLRFRNEFLSDDNQKIFVPSNIKEIKERRLISDQEIDIIINELLINSSKYFRKNPSELTRISGNSLLENIKSVYKNIVTVDEATDFSSITLSCMFHLCNPLIRSCTLTGDLMQRVTNVGIQKWEDCSSFFDNIEKKPLSKVYRQSYKLLKIAAELYEDFVGEVGFQSAFEEDEKDPEPLMFESSNREGLKNWLIARILEIYSITSGKATIALFVSEDSEIDSLDELIADKLSDRNLEVEKCKGGKILSVGSKIRIFSVEYIKGLEFESVFFIDIDEIYKRKPNLVDKYLYVGLTRAGSFLGVTYKNEFPEPLEFIRKYFKEDGDWSWLAK